MIITFSIFDSSIRVRYIIKPTIKWAPKINVSSNLDVFRVNVLKKKKNMWIVQNPNHHCILVKYINKEQEKKKKKKVENR